MLWRKEPPFLGFSDIAFADPPKTAGGDILLQIVESDAFKATGHFFAATSPWNEGFVSATGLALLYYIIRALRPRSVVEIGSCNGWTAQVLARAIDANGYGELHTVGPYDSWRFLPLFEQWPKPLRDRTTFHPVNSMHFFQDSILNNKRHDIVFVDGSHDYEFALFDIQCSALTITPPGFIFVDDAGQEPIRRAADDFLKANDQWIECVDILDSRDIIILRGPASNSDPHH